VCSYILSSYDICNLGMLSHKIHSALMQFMQQTLVFRFVSILTYMSYVEKCYYRIPKEKTTTTISLKRVKIESVDNYPLNATYVCFTSSPDLLDKIPFSVTHLEFEQIPKHPITNLLSVTHIIFSCIKDFNQPISFLPSLTYIDFMDSFNQPVDNLPSSLC
jgi:hypothetical protein